VRAIATLATTGAGSALASSSRAAVSLEFWNPATDTHGRTVIADAVARFNATIGKRAGIVVRDRPTPEGDGYVKYTTAMSSSGSPDVVMN
jgi:ABC-type glycerol-3-phosphate transport system substrate-binding protein